ncbi:MAG: hypothetical protein IPI33_09230 [Dehalococcoidia bacterium]|jgi:hypothetical protein|nr:hypothetical protein [Dehalococcoidia bacterium]MBK9547193.1 hypothetical protein [Dehalococcoidia bacterium]
MKRTLALSAVGAFLISTLVACDPKPASGITPIDWRLENDSGVRVLSVTRQERTVDDSTNQFATIRVLVDGTWNTGPAAKPRVFGDGVELVVGGAGNYATVDGPQTSVEANIPNGKTPKTLLVQFVTAGSPAEIRLRLSP